MSFISDQFCILENHVKRAFDIYNTRVNTGETVQHYRIQTSPITVHPVTTEKALRAKALLVEVFLFYTLSSRIVYVFWHKNYLLDLSVGYFVQRQSKTLHFRYNRFP